MKPPEPTSRPDLVGIGYNRLKIQKNPFPISKDVRRVLGLIVIAKTPRSVPDHVVDVSILHGTVSHRPGRSCAAYSPMSLIVSKSYPSMDMRSH